MESLTKHARLQNPYAVRLHVLDAPAAVRRRRVRERNVARPDGYFVEITDDVFDFMEARSQPVTNDEAGDLVRVDTA